jgi:hypothetical protein
MKNAKRSKRVGGSKPSSLKGRSERHSSALSAKQNRRTGGVQRTPLAHDHTGSFGAFRAPKLVGVSDTVRQSNRDLARRASREMKAWSRTLPKGVKV